MTHDKISFTAEYCRARRIPYKFKNETLYIAKKYICYSVFNLTYSDIILTIDNSVIYDSLTQYFVELA